MIFNWDDWSPGAFLCSSEDLEVWFIFSDKRQELTLTFTNLTVRYESDGSRLIVDSILELDYSPLEHVVTSKVSTIGTNAVSLVEMIVNGDLSAIESKLEDLYDKLKVLDDAELTQTQLNIFCELV